MANVTNKQWCDMMNRIHSGRSCLTQEAQKLGISLDELITLGDNAHIGADNEREKEWRRTKRESSKRDKQMIHPRKMRKPATTSVSAPAPELAPAPASANPMEELLHRKDELQKEIADGASSIENSKAILEIRQKALVEAQAVFEKARMAVEKAQTDVVELKTAIQKTENVLTEAEKMLQEVEKEIEKHTVYIIAPWYLGTLPECGTFISSEQMEGCNVLKAKENIEPDFKEMISSGFDLGSEYVRALAFVALVQDFVLDGKKHNVLNTDQRVQKLLDKYIG